MDTMTDEPPPPPPPPPPPRPSGAGSDAWSQFQAWFASLHRSTRQRWVAGVCGGVAERFGVHHTVVRAGFVLALFVGFGVPLYLLAWVLVPDDTGRRVLGDSVTRDAVAVAAMVVAGGWFLAELDAIPWIFGRAFPWLVILVGVVLLLRRGEDAGAARPDPPGAPAAPPEVAEVPEAPVTQFTPATSVTSVTPATPFTPAAPRVPRPPRAPRVRPFVGPLTLCVAIAAVGLVAIVGRATGAYTLSAGAGLAIAMVAVGAGLVVSAFRGRARGLLVPAVVLGATLMSLSSLDVRLDRAGWPMERTIVDGSDLPAAMHAVVGGSRVDLADLRLDGDRTLRLEQAIGSLDVVLPRHVRTVVDVEVGTGVVDLRRPSARESLYLDALVDRWATAGPPAEGATLAAREVELFRERELWSDDRRLDDGDRRLEVGPRNGPRLRIVVRLGAGIVTLHDLRWTDVPERIVTPARLCTVAGGAVGVSRPCDEVDAALRVPLCWNDGRAVDCRSVDPDDPEPTAACRSHTGEVVDCDVAGIHVDDPATVGRETGSGATVPPITPEAPAAPSATAPAPTAPPSTLVPAAPGPSVPPLPNPGG